MLLWTEKYAQVIPWQVSLLKSWIIVSRPHEQIKLLKENLPRWKLVWTTTRKESQVPTYVEHQCGDPISSGRRDNRCLLRALGKIRTGLSELPPVSWAERNSPYYCASYQCTVPRKCPPGGGGTLYDRPRREVPPERGPFFDSGIRQGWKDVNFGIWKCH